MAATQKLVDEQFYDDELPFIQNVERLCGHDAAASLIEHFGGRRVFIPYKARLPTATDPGSPLLQALSVEHANLLGYVVGGAHFDVPMGGNVEGEVLRLTRQGVSVSEIARQLRRTERGVYKIRSRLRDAGDLPATLRGGAND